MPNPKRKRVRRPEFGPPSPTNVKDALRVVRTPDAAAAIARWQAVLDKKRGPRQKVRVEAMMFGIILTDLEYRPPLLKNIWGTLVQLPKPLREELGITVWNRDITYRQISYTNCRLAQALREKETEDSGVSAVCALVNEVLNATITDIGGHIDFGTAAAIDGTAVEVHARLQFKERTDIEPGVNKETGEKKPKFKGWSLDPDAAHGHFPSKNGQKASLKMGYEIHALAPIPEHPNHRFPNVIRRIEATPNTTGDRPLTLALIQEAHNDGICDNLALDQGYHTRGNWYHVAIMDMGIDIEYEPHPDYMARQNVHGSHVRNGQRYCVRTPQGLLDLPAHTKGAPAEKALELAALYDERQKYVFSRTGPNRWRCPGDPKVATAMCAIRGTDTIGEPGRRVFIVGADPAAKELPKSCKQTTTTYSEAKLRPDTQHHPYGTTKWLKGYARRSRVEGAFAQVKFNHSDAARDKFRMFGIQKYSLVFGLKAAATNIKLIRSFNESTEDEINSS